VTSQETFGPRYRRIRIRRGITLEAIATATNVPVALWEALEDDELGVWPSGVLARALVGEYARLLGIDPDETVNEFCRLFPNGDRRRSRIIAEYADLIGQPMVWTEERPVRVERRAPMRQLQERRLASKRERALGILIDVLALAASTALLRATTAMPYSTAAIAVGVAYYVGSTMAGASAGTWLRQRISRTPLSSREVLPLLFKRTS
jgi:transcriptional regulator with XRE-family HTH domain